MKALITLLSLPFLLMACQTPDAPTTVQQTPLNPSTKKVKTETRTTSPTTKKVIPYPLKTCLVTDEGLNDWDEQTSIVYQNKELKFCCKMCVKKFQKSPQKYLNKLPK